MSRPTLVGACLLLAVPAAVQAQPAAPAKSSSTTAVSDVSRSHGRHATRLYLGMWTTHLKEDVVVLKNNWMVGLSHGGYFGATFMNSFGRRGFAGGLERTLVSTGNRPNGASLGLRLGFVTGYDGRLMRFARRTPVLPLIQPFATIDLDRIGFEVSYTFVVVSVAVSYGL